MDARAVGTALVCLATMAWAETPKQAVERLAVVPRPTRTDWLPGAFELTAKSAVRYAPKAEGAKEAAEFLAAWLRPATGFALPVKPLGGWLSGAIFDWTGSYRAAFVNGIAWNALNLTIVLFLILRARGVPPLGTALEPGRG